MESRRTCTHVFLNGTRCQTKPHKGNDKCGKHKSAKEYSTCRFCGRNTYSSISVCADCHRAKWRVLRRERKVEEYVSQLLAGPA